MQNLVNLDEKRVQMKQTHTQRVYGRALCLAQIHELRNRAEFRLKKLYSEFAGAFYQGDTQRVRALTADISMEKGKYEAFLYCSQILEKELRG